MDIKLHNTWTSNCTIHGHQVAQCMDIKLHNAWTSSCTMHGHQVAQCMDIKLRNAWTSSCTMHGHQVAQCMDTKSHDVMYVRTLSTVPQRTLKLVPQCIVPLRIIRLYVRLSVCLSVRQHFACKHDNSTNINRIGPKLTPWMYLKSVLVKFEDG